MSIKTLIETIYSGNPADEIFVQEMNERRDEEVEKRRSFFSESVWNKVPLFKIPKYNLKSICADIIKYYPNDGTTADAVKMLETALKEGQIYNTDFVPMNKALARAAEYLYLERVHNMYMLGKDKSLPSVTPEEKKLIMSTNMSTYKEIKNSIKRIDAYKGEKTQFVSDIIAMAKGMEILATAIETVSNHVVKGKKPKAN